MTNKEIGSILQAGVGMKENACGCCYMTSNIPMKCTCQWCHQAIEKELG